MIVRNRGPAFPPGRWTKPWLNANGFRGEAAEASSAQSWRAPIRWPTSCVKLIDPVGAAPWHDREGEAFESVRGRLHQEPVSAARAVDLCLRVVDDEDHDIRAESVSSAVRIGERAARPLEAAQVAGRIPRLHVRHLLGANEPEPR